MDTFISSCPPAFAKRAKIENVEEIGEFDNLYRNNREDEDLLYKNRLECSSVRSGINYLYSDIGMDELARFIKERPLELLVKSVPVQIDNGKYGANYHYRYVNADKIQFACCVFRSVDSNNRFVILHVKITSLSGVTQNLVSIIGANKKMHDMAFEYWLSCNIEFQDNLEYAEIIRQTSTDVYHVSIEDIVNVSIFKFGYSEVKKFFFYEGADHNLYKSRDDVFVSVFLVRNTLGSICDRPASYSLTSSKNVEKTLCDYFDRVISNLGYALYGERYSAFATQNAYFEKYY